MLLPQLGGASSRPGSLAGFHSKGRSIGRSSIRSWREGSPRTPPWAPQPSPGASIRRLGCRGGRAEWGERQRAEPGGRNRHPAQHRPPLQCQPLTPLPRETPRLVPAAPPPTPQGTSHPSVLPFPSLPFGKSGTRFPPQRGTFLKGSMHRGAAQSRGPALASSRTAKPPAPPATRGAALLPQPRRCCAPASEMFPGPHRCLPHGSQP